MSTFAEFVPKKKLPVSEVVGINLGPGFVGFAGSTLGAASSNSYHLLFLLAWLRNEAQGAVALAAAGADTRGRTKSVKQRRELIFAR